MMAAIMPIASITDHKAHSDPAIFFANITILLSFGFWHPLFPFPLIGSEFISQLGLSCHFQKDMNIRTVLEEEAEIRI